MAVFTGSTTTVRAALLPIELIQRLSLATPRADFRLAAHSEIVARPRRRASEWTSDIPCDKERAGPRPP